MKKEDKLLIHSSGYFFLSVVFEKNFFFFYKNSVYSKNTKYMVMNDHRITKSLVFFFETKPLLLIDMVGFDNIHLENIDNVIHKRFNFLYLFYSIKLDSYLSMINLSGAFKSISSFFKNAIWSERELSEMFNFKFIGQYDCRNLMLEYGFKKGILLKKHYVFDNLNLKADYYNKITYQNNLFNMV